MDLRAEPTFAVTTSAIEIGFNRANGRLPFKEPRWSIFLERANRTNSAIRK